MYFCNKFPQFLIAVCDIYIYRIKNKCTINSKINGTTKGFYLPISNLHSILAAANLLAHDNITIIKLLFASKFATVKIEFSFEMGK